MNTYENNKIINKEKLMAKLPAITDAEKAFFIDQTTQLKNLLMLYSWPADFLKIEGIKKIEEVNTYPIKIKTDHIEDSVINLIEEDSLLNTEYRVNGVTLNQALADSLNVQVGDSITIIIDGKQYERVVEQIFTVAYLKGVFDEKSNFEELGIPATQVWIELEDGVDPYAVKEKLEKLDYVLEVLTLEENFEYVNSLLSNVKMMTDVVKVFAIALAIIVIYNLASLNINERIKSAASKRIDEPSNAKRSFITETAILICCVSPVLLTPIERSAP